MANVSAQDPSAARDARRVYVDTLAQGYPGLAENLIAAARERLDLPAEPGPKYVRGETLRSLMRSAAAWQADVVNGLYTSLNGGFDRTDLPAIPATDSHSLRLSLVDESVIERDILVSALEVSIADASTWEFADLRARLSLLEQHREPGPDDVVRPAVLARLMMRSWSFAGQSLDGWRDLQPVIHRSAAELVVEACHEANRWLVDKGVLPEIDLRPFIRVATAPAGSRRPAEPVPAEQGGGPAASAARMPMTAAGASLALHRIVESLPRPGGSPPRGLGADATEVRPLRGFSVHGPDTAGAALERLGRLAAGHTGEVESAPLMPQLTPGLSRAIDDAQAELRIGGAIDSRLGDAQLTMPMLLRDLGYRKEELKTAAGSEAERATIEIVALMFQSLLAEDRVPFSIRVWFARLQMPVLRVAVTEPGFFAALDHPARQLIDRMGGVCMGLGASDDPMTQTLEKEIRRVVQVVEAYPDTGRRVFQTVLNEFEEFLKTYLSSRNEVTREAVSVAQQVEQRETLAIQYTIELRRMLNEVPVQDGVRQFLFRVWADVLAIASVNHGGQSEQVRQAKRTAVDLIWSASAKVSREERAAVIGKVPVLLKALRDGMAASGMEPDRQDEEVRNLNNALAAAFTAKAAVVPRERFTELLEQLETLEEMLPDAVAGGEEIDESVVHDLAVDGQGRVEVMREPGADPSPAMVAWARELQVGTWYELQSGDAAEPMQLAWQGLRKQLSLFVNSSGRCALFQLRQLAAFLQAGKLRPAQEEALTARATRHALERLDVDPAQLLR